MITPATYTTAEIHQRFHRSLRWWTTHRQKLIKLHGFPSPTDYDKRLYNRAEVDAWFKTGGNSSGRIPRQVRPKLDDILDQRLKAIAPQAEG